MSIAFDDTTFDTTPTWTALDQAHPNLVVSWRVDRGRAYELDRTEGGKATVEIIDRDGLLDPTNFTSPYAGNIVPLKQIALCRRDPIAAEWQERFRGWISDINIIVDRSQMFTRVVIECVDLFELLGAMEMLPGEFGDVPPAGSSDLIFFENTTTMGARVDQVRANAGIPADFFVTFSGNVALTQSIYSVGESPLTVIQEAADSEWPGVANVYCDRHGCLSTHGRYARFDPAAVIAGGGAADDWDYHTFSVGDGTAVNADPGNVAQLKSFEFESGVSKIINSASAYPQWILDGAEYRMATDAEIAAQTVQDTTSIGLYGLRSWSAHNLQTEAGTVFPETTGLEETQKFAQYYVDNFSGVVAGEPVIPFRINRVSFRPMRPGAVGSAITWQLMSRVDIQDELTITLDVPGGGGFFEELYCVEGISETSKPLNGSYDDDTVTLDLSPKAFFGINPFPVPS